MPFIPHTADDVKRMLDVIGVADIEELFDEIPHEIRCKELTSIDRGLNEIDISRLMHERAQLDNHPLCFIGAGAYDHHIPAVVWELTTRGEYYTAYTPYQAEASQGTLQLLYEFQSMMSALTAMGVSNASMYDGASALAEAVLMAIRINRKAKSRKVLVPRALHPEYRKTVHTIVHNQNIELVELPFDLKTGKTAITELQKINAQDYAALIIAQPNFFGVLEDVDAMVNWASENQLTSIGVVNPLAMAIIKPAGEWGAHGVDICCGEGQPLGIPLSSGGPYFGFLCCKRKHVRQIPGRIIGRTIDLDNNPGYVLTLQAREQHIRRSKATSNICTNQGLMVTAATIHMALMGAGGLETAAHASHANAHSLINLLTAIDGVTKRFDAPVFHEQVLALDQDVDEIIKALSVHNLLAGYRLSKDYPELENCLLICSTEKHNQADHNRYAELMHRVIETRRKAGCPVKPKFD